MLEKVISGGQTGVDRAALDAAMELGIPVGGWCPKGRLAEDGQIPERYPLVETESRKYPVRTARNVADSDGTLVLHRGTIDRGTALTIRLAQRMKKPHWVIDLAEKPNALETARVIKAAGVRVLNVAGPRASSDRRIYSDARDFLEDLFQAFSLQEDNNEK